MLLMLAGASGDNTEGKVAGSSPAPVALFPIHKCCCSATKGRVSKEYCKRLAWSSARTRRLSDFGPVGLVASNPGCPALSGGRSGKGGTTTGYLLPTLRVGFGQGVRWRTPKLQGPAGRVSYVEEEHRPQLKNWSLVRTGTLVLLLLAFGKFTSNRAYPPERPCSIGRGRSGCWQSL